MPSDRTYVIRYTEDSINTPQKWWNAMLECTHLIN